MSKNGRLHHFLGRRFFMKTLLFTLLPCLAALSLIAFRPVTHKPSPKPTNIIYVLADDLGYGDLSVYGQKHFQTPNLDQMAREGVRLTDFYAGSTVCAPSRCALMTGKHMGHAYIRGNGEIPLRDGPTGAEDFTLAEFLKQHGYRTGMFGKWGIGMAHNSGSPEKQGWDEFLGYCNQSHAHHFYTHNLWTIRDNKTVIFPHDSLRHAHLTIMEGAFDFVKRNQTKPFFLYLAVTMPHAEVYAPTPDDVAPFLTADGKSRFPETPFVQKAGNYRSQPNPKANFAGMVTHLDRDMGQLMALLRELGLAENTVVMFTSDNGPHREGGGDPDFFDSNGPLRGIKRDLYEGGIRVPFLAWGKDVAKGRVIAEPLANWDIFTTVADLTGTTKDLPSGLDGLSFMSLLQGKKSLAKPHPYLYWEFYERGFDQAVRMGRWKAVRQSSQGNQLELYDLSKDLGETTNVAAQHPDLVAQMEHTMESARVKSDMWPLKK